MPGLFHPRTKSLNALLTSDFVVKYIPFCEKGTGMQIDLILIRDDNVVNMCEIKYYSDDFTVSDDYYRVLLRRQEALRKELPKRASVQSTLITTFGLSGSKNVGAFSNVITIDDLFAV